LSRLWLVPYASSYSGTVEIEADTAAEAEAMVNAGDYEDDPGQERYDWGTRGRAKLTS
jgi:hypothetical protein